eukprot:4777343-Amphidinium_carterae.1
MRQQAVLVHHSSICVGNNLSVLVRTLTQPYCSRHVLGVGAAMRIGEASRPAFPYGMVSSCANQPH